MSATHASRNPHLTPNLSRARERGPRFHAVAGVSNPLSCLRERGGGEGML